MYKEIKWILVNNLWLVSLYFGFQRTVQAQNAPVITAATVLNAVPGQQVSIPITVSNFNNIGSTTLSLDYDPTKLQFVSATSNPLLGGSCNTGDNLIANGKHRLILGWFNLSGKSLPDGSQIVKYVFTYISGSPTLQWYDDGPSCNFTDILLKKLNDIPASTYYINGFVCGSLPNTVTISGANAAHYGQAGIEYSVPLDPSLTYNWSYSGTGATIIGSSNTVMINFSASASAGTLKVSASNSCNTSIGTKDIQLYPLLPPAFTTGPTNVNLHSSGNIYTVQPGMNNYSWTVKGGTITSGGTAVDNSVTIIWNTAGNQSVSVKYDDLGVSTPVTLYPVTVNPAVLTITGITAHKTYDGTNKATLNTVSAGLKGVFDPDVVTLNAVGATGTFEDKNVGTGKLITTSGFTLNGPNAGNYIVTSLVITGDITPATVTISGIKADNKTYDGNTTATLNTGSALLTGIIGPDIVTLLTSRASGTFAGKNVASGIKVATSGFTLGGANAGNYLLIQPVLTAGIIPATLTISGLTTNKVYDRSLATTLNTGSAALVGVISTDIVTLNTSGVSATFADMNVGTGKIVTTSGFTLDGANAGNYIVTSPAITGDITPATVTISGIKANNKTYDGNTTTSLNTGSALLTGIIGPDIVTLLTSGATGTFAGKNVASGIKVTTSGFTLGGANAGNYLLIQPVLTADIIPNGLLITIAGVTAENKVYDGTTDAALNIANAKMIGVIFPDVVILNMDKVTGAFVDKNTGNDKTIIISGFSISGKSAANYTLIQPILKANILPFATPLTITGVTANNKTYDGTTTVSLNISSARLVGNISTDTVILNVKDATGTFADKNAATGKQVNTIGFKIEGINALNYTLTQPTLTADIKVATITVNNITANNKIYDGSDTAVINTGSAALIRVVSPDDVKLISNKAIGTFADKNVGSGRIVRPSGLFINGADAGNYTLISPLLSANISPKSLKITAKNMSKCFGLMPDFAGDAYTSEGLEKNDTVKYVTLSSDGFYMAAPAGTYDIVPENALGTGLSNYAITYVKGILTVNPIANQPAEFSLSTSNVCQGAVGVTYTVPNDPFERYNWSYSGTGVTIHENTHTAILDFSLTATSGILSVTASSSCGTSPARTLPITVDTLKCKSSIVFTDKSLYSNVGEGIQWYKNMTPIPGATSQNYTPFENGKYFNIISNRCYSDTSNFINVIISNTTQYMSNSIQIFPNPAKEYFTLRSSDALSETMRLSIFSSNCILIKNYEITNLSVNRENLIDVRQLSSGLYFIRIDTGHKTITQKLIIL